MAGDDDLAGNRIKTPVPFEVWRVGRGKTALKEKGAKHVVCGTNDVLVLTILDRGVRTRHLKMNTTCEEELAGARVVKIAAIVVNCLNGHSKLSIYICK